MNLTGIKKLHIYTDGSADTKTRKGGCGYVITDPECTIVPVECSHDFSDTTNNQMELTAVLCALKDHDYDKGCVITIFTDSELVVNWMNGTYMRRNSYVRQICDNIETVIKRKNLKVEFVKIKGHSGNVFNDMADALAGRYKTQ